MMILGGLGGRRYIRTGAGGVGYILRDKPMMILGGLGGNRYIRRVRGEAKASTKMHRAAVRKSLIQT
jgi:hypothetical protein